MVKRRREQEEVDVADVSINPTVPNGSSTSEEHDPLNEVDDTNNSEDLDDDDDDDDESGDEEEQSAKRSKVTRPQLSAQDVQIARETAELFKSNIFKLEIDELVKELRLKESHCKLVEKVLHRLHDIIQQVPKSAEFTLTEAEKYISDSKHKISIPFPDPKPTGLNYKLQYDTPENISLVGSFGLKTGIQQQNGMSIDVALTMPKSLFQPKDYLNYRALYKRSFYISYLANYLITLTKKNHLPVKISYEYVNGDKLCPALHIESYTPDNVHDDDLIFEKTKFSIRLIVGFEFGLFESKKLLPDRNCVRVQSESDDGKLPPTPLYNASILSSTTYNYYLKYLYTNKKSADSFRDAAVLGKLWLKQRGFSSHVNEGGFGHFEFAMLMTALLGGGGENGNKILLHGFSSYQLFKGTIKYLATQDLCNEGYLSFSSVVGEVNSVYKKNGFNVPTLFDKNTKINILWKMTNSSYSVLKKLANDTLQLLNDVVQDRFRPIFILSSNNPLLKYDTLIQLPLAHLNQKENFGPVEKISFLTFENFVCSKVHRILSKALDERAYQISVTASFNDSKWSIHKRKPSFSSENDDKYITIGLYLNPLECEKKVTKGPLHSDKANGEKFASFWGNKAQVRKYKDGNIQYSCLWSPSPIESTVVTITKYILDLHLTKDISQKLITNSTKFTQLIPRPITSLANSTQPIISPSNFQTLKNSYNDLSKILLNLKLPLAVRSILPISPALRNTSLILPVPFSVADPDFFNESILQFESSMKWPDELIALERTKTAFLLKIDELINKETAYKSFIVKDEHTIPYNNQVTVLHISTPDGFGFKFRVLTERDEVLYLRAIENATEKQKAIVTNVYLEFVQKYMGSVKHHRALSTLVNHFPFFSPTVRLFKRWLESQLLSHHFSDELIELIAIKVFVDPAPFSVPSSVESGFLRILHFLCNWNWKEDPLILDLAKDFENSEEKNNYIDKISDRLTVQTYQSMYNNFYSLRRDDPNALKVQFFIGSKEDPSGKLWSLNKVTLPIASRLTALSKASISLLLKSPDVNEKVLKMIFTPALKDYDFAIKLKTQAEFTTRSGLLPTNKFKNLIQTPTSFPDDIYSLQDPVQAFFEELQSKYNNAIILSSNKYTGLNENGNVNVITGLFNPSVTSAKKKFRVNIGYNTKPTEDEQLLFNKEAVLNEIVTLGGDLISSVEFK
ncbi:hypothetical protein CANARDRAFT_6343 [[Candida] arabinofermentans NRRL YB-2248]|uniref:U3 small nucleolar RNA-associated protein 22 n=1 Tax=[Candida] arabinofermentans NRRL YB-2248 TaxID=983967 RepID=A0A1E4T4V1_9ASCO|nr:hypothetical protein CANARDRAFT_6343 [[Candida] arabinofermentans NRRL YB-2248]